MILKRIALTTFTLIIFLTGSKANAQYSLVKRVVAETEDGIVFRASIRNPAIDYGKEIMIYYSVKNLSSKVLYLVRKDSPEFDTEGGVILVQAPIPAPVGHGGYDYTFRMVQPRKEYRGTVSIPSQQYDKADIWPIHVAFGYVRNVSGLNRRLREGEDPAALRGLLNSRIRTVVLGSLSVEVKPADR
jgi:hypothetical protein